MGVTAIFEKELMNGGGYGCGKIGTGSSAELRGESVRCDDVLSGVWEVGLKYKYE